MSGGPSWPALVGASLLLGLGLVVATVLRPLHIILGILSPGALIGLRLGRGLHPTPDMSPTVEHMLPRAAVKMLNSRYQYKAAQREAGGHRSGEEGTGGDIGELRSVLERMEGREDRGGMSEQNI